MEEHMIRVGITHGDINGIGYEIILKTFSDSRMAELCIPIVYGSSKIAAYHRKALELPSLNISNISRAEDAGGNRINMINSVDDGVKVELGKPSESAGHAAIKSLEDALSDAKKNIIDVVVSAPVNTQTIPGDTRCFPGHTEYLEQNYSKNETALTILVSDDLRIGLATGCIPFDQITSQITKELVLQKLLLFNRSLIEDFNIIKPRIAVLSLNPRAGDAGLAGNEEETIIIPAMQKAEKEGVLSFGPYAVDGFFGSRVHEKFDGILAMYHDQGFTPFKTLTMLNGVSFAAGLPVVHTTPAHGTAYDISGKNLASEDSFRHAVYLALDIYRNRERYKKATQNPLRKQYFEKGADEKIDLTKEEADTL